MIDFSSAVFCARTWLCSKILNYLISSRWFVYLHFVFILSQFRDFFYIFLRVHSFYMGYYICWHEAFHNFPYGSFNSFQLVEIAPLLFLILINHFFILLYSLTKCSSICRSDFCDVFIFFHLFSIWSTLFPTFYFFILITYSFFITS